MQPRQVGRDARQHLFALDRLGDVVDRAELESRHLVRRPRRAPTGRSRRMSRVSGSALSRGTPRSRPCPASSRRAAPGRGARLRDVERGGPSLATRMRWPLPCSVRTSTWRLVGLSSTTRMVEGGGVNRLQPSLRPTSALERVRQLAHAVEIETGGEAGCVRPSAASSSSPDVSSSAIVCRSRDRADRRSVAKSRAKREHAGPGVAEQRQLGCGRGIAAAERTSRRGAFAAPRTPLPRAPASARTRTAGILRGLAGVAEGRSP